MKNFVTSLFRSMLPWFRLARRAQPEERISPEQLRKAFTEMLADPQTRGLLLEDLVGLVFPIQGAVCSVLAKDVGPGDFGSDPACGGGVYTFPARMGAVAFAIGSSLMPTGGAGNSFRTGLGVNAYWDGSNWVTKGDGANNGAALILGSNGVAALTFFLYHSLNGRR